MLNEYINKHINRATYTLINGIDNNYYFLQLEVSCLTKNIKHETCFMFYLMNVKHDYLGEKH